MCSSKCSKPQTLSHINGRPVLQPNCSNRSNPLLERRNSLKKSSTNSTTTTTITTPLQPLSPSAASTNSPKVIRASVTTPPASPKLKSPRQPANKRGNIDPSNGLNSSLDKVNLTPRSTTKSLVTSTSVKKSKKSNTVGGGNSPNNSTDNSSSLKYSSSLIVEAPGSIAAARREQVAIMQVQRKMRIAHYGRTKSAKYEGKVIPLDHSSPTTTTIVVKEEKRCNFITSNSDPTYIAYHDEEWGVPVHDDKLLFELLVLTGAQVGSDWTSVLKKRQDSRDAFSGFDPEIVAKFNEKKMTSMCTDYGIELSQVRGAVDNANRILEIKKEFGSFDMYLWSFVNNKPIATQYKSCLKMPVKTSKSESISKAMVRRGFRYVGPTVMHSFMQAAGLTNDHLITCPRHLQCLALASQSPSVPPN